MRGDDSCMHIPLPLENDAERRSIIENDAESRAMVGNDAESRAINGWKHLLSPETCASHRLHVNCQLARQQPSTLPLQCWTQTEQYRPNLELHVPNRVGYHE